MIQRILSFISTSRILLFPFTYIYRFLFYLDQTFTKKKEISNSIVISVGNLSVGGTGKTPFTIFLIEFLRYATEFPICVLSRGYLGKNSKHGMKVELDSNPKDCGDEPLLIKKTHPSTEVIIGRKRYESFYKYSSLLNQKKIILLDDGFQHHAIQRDYDFVLIDSQTLLGNRHTLPFGLLREPIQAVRRAHAIVFTKYSQIHHDQVKKLESQLKEINPQLKFFYMYFTPKHFQNRSGTIRDIQAVKGKSLCVFSGIGNFESLKVTIEGLEPREVNYIQFPDHHSFTEKEVLEIVEENLNKEIICTEKDFVKFLSWIGNQPIYEKIYYLVMQTKVEPENLLKQEIKNLLHKFR
ncbi:MAG: tetraacyldisaccharide 4'-kinase [Leptospiraceae bacterium]|nr:tetraacyldisaccharide 4'-kinase [Leptospiraceae bacterium]